MSVLLTTVAASIDAETHMAAISAPAGTDIRCTWMVTTARRPSASSKSRHRMECCTVRIIL